MTILIAVLCTAAFVLASLRPRVGFRRAAPSANAGCGEVTLLISYDRLRLRRATSGYRLRRARRNLMLASYGWGEPAPHETQ